MNALQRNAMPANAFLANDSQDFQGGISSCPEGGAECNEEGEEKLDHELTVLT
jgi:hypothetical protein